MPTLNEIGFVTGAVCAVVGLALTQDPAHMMVGGGAAVAGLLLAVFCGWCEIGASRRRWWR